MSRDRAKIAAIGIAAIVTGQWLFDWLPNVVAVPILVIGALLLLVDFARWLDRNAY
jgi:hypothetical protein